MKGGILCTSVREVGFMSSLLWQAIGYACGISLGLLGLVALVNVLVGWLDRQTSETPEEPTESPEPCSTTEGSPSA